MYESAQFPDAGICDPLVSDSISHAESEKAVSADLAQGGLLGAFAEIPPVVTVPPAGRRAPLIVSSPHGGRLYSPEFLAQTRLSLSLLRSGEDSFVEELVSSAPMHGATLIYATFPRAFCDPNRALLDLDPAMFDAGEDSDFRPTYRALSGLGSIPRVVSNGHLIYSRKLAMDEVRARLERFWQPYHDALVREIDRARQEFGISLVVDMHSMPGGLHPDDPDFVIGDSFGTTCDPRVVETILRVLRQSGYTVVRNVPFAGGYIAQHYGRPKHASHAVQIEINKRLYLKNGLLERGSSFGAIREDLDRLFMALSELIS